jgi:4a-hydroxytetrahydrobiopterin dehydratase
VALREERCEACHGGTPTVRGAEVQALKAELDPGWEVAEDETRLRRQVRVGDFGAALAAAVRVGMVAESQGHHPDLTVAWGRLGIELWTHAVSGLTRTDFVLAAHIDAALER